MNITPPQSDGQLALAGARFTERFSNDAFAREMSAARSSDDSQLRHAATQLVSSALLMPVMKMLGEGTFATGPFAPSSAEKHFQPLLNQHLTEGIVGAANFPIVDAIVDRYAHLSGGSIDARA